MVRCITDNVVHSMRRILIVDDIERFAYLLRIFLKDLPGCVVEIATSAQQALHLFQQEPFDLLITDYSMPGMNGLTLARRIQECYPQTQVLMVTVCGSDDLSRATRASMLRVLDKSDVTGIISAAWQALERGHLDQQSNRLRET